MTSRNERAAGQYDAAKRKLRDSDDITAHDREILTEFDEVLRREALDSDDLGKGRWGNHLDNLRIMAERTGALADALEPGPEGEAAKTSLLEYQTDKKRFAGTTIATCLQALQLFGRRMVDEDDHPEVYARFDDLEPESYRPDDPTPLRTNIVDWEDAIAMAKTRDHARDQAIILTQWAAGARPEAELWPLQYKHVEVHDDHVVLSIPTEAKDGERRDVYIFAGSAIFRQWFKREHPARLECEPGPGPETYVWTHLNRNSHISYDTYYGVFNGAGAATDIEKDCYPLHFRRSRASVLASRPEINEQDLRNHFGWSWNSDKPRNYIATFGGETGKHVAAADGATIDWDEPAPISPVTCSACDQQTTRHFEHCIYCETPLPETDQVEERIVESPGVSDVDLLDLIMDGDVDGDTIRQLRKVEGVLRTRPDVLDDLDELEKLADRYHGEDGKSDESGGVQAAFGPASVGVHASKMASAAAAKWVRAKHAALSLDPRLEHYPPGPQRGAGIVAGQMAVVAAALVTLWAAGPLQSLLAGEPLAVIATVIGLTIGVGMVARDIPTVDEAAAELLD